MVYKGMRGFSCTLPLSVFARVLNHHKYMDLLINYVQCRRDFGQMIAETIVHQTSINKAIILYLDRHNFIRLL